MTETFAVVFQMGKVASTAITSALDTLPGVTAVQSHFLGADALSRVVHMAVEPMNNDYFFEHQLGQLTQNLKYTRQINRIRAGADPYRLVVLSLSRDPYSWFRSSLVQDIDGMADLLESLAPEDAGFRRAARIGAGLTRFLGMAADQISKFETVDAFRKALHARQPDAWEDLADWPFLQRQLMMNAMLTTDWFGPHLSSGLGLRLGDLSRDGQIWRYEDEHAQIGILRYEDLGTAFPDFCAWAFGTSPRLRVENASDTKPLAGVINAAFESEEGLRLRAALMRSDYASHFGYS